MSEDIANAEFPEPDWEVSPYDAYQDTLVVWLMSKYPGVFGRFHPKFPPRYVAIFPHRVSDEKLAKLTRL